MNLFLFCVMFFVKKGSFPAKTAVRANTLLLKIRNNVNMKTLRNIYFAIFDSIFATHVLFGLKILIQ